MVLEEDVLFDVVSNRNVVSIVIAMYVWNNCFAFIVVQNNFIEKFADALCKITSQSLFLLDYRAAIWKDMDVKEVDGGKADFRLENYNFQILKEVIWRPNEEVKK